jgi:hypothetical protein
LIEREMGARGKEKWKEGGEEREGWEQGTEREGRTQVEERREEEKKKGGRRGKKRKEGVRRIMCKLTRPRIRGRKMGGDEMNDHDTVSRKERKRRGKRVMEPLRGNKNSCCCRFVA